MAWEARGSRRYYTRSKRVNGRVVREYVGTGPVAELAAAADSLRRADRLAALAPLMELSRVADLMARAALLAAGYHRHSRSSWRKKRYVYDSDRGPEARRGP